jgi:hypothetical protein
VENVCSEKAFFRLFRVFSWKNNINSVVHKSANLLVYRSLNATVAQLRNCTFRVSTAIELKTTKTSNNNRQQNKIKISNPKAIPEYYNRDIFESTLCFTHF